MIFLLASLFDTLVIMSEKELSYKGDCGRLPIVTLLEVMMDSDPFQLDIYESSL